MPKFMQKRPGFRIVLQERAPNIAVWGLCNSHQEVRGKTMGEWTFGGEANAYRGIIQEIWTRNICF